MIVLLLMNLSYALQAESFQVRYEIVGQGPETSSTYIYIVSLENSITINRGNCKLFRGEKGLMSAGKSNP